MGYLMVIVQASQDYEGQAWARYDEAFPHRAVIGGNRCWSKLSTTIYTMCFTQCASRGKPSLQHLYKDKLAPGTVESYLAAVCHSQIALR